MSEWHSFITDTFQAFQADGITHEVPLHDETELYTVGNEIGLSGRFVRNLCDPVIKALGSSIIFPSRWMKDRRESSKYLSSSDLKERLLLAKMASIPSSTIATELDYIS